MLFKKQAVLFALVSLWIVKEVELIGFPAGKCRKPIPSYPGMNFTKVEGHVYKYVYTPDVTMFKYMDSIAMLIKHVGKNIYSQVFRAHTIFGTTTNLKFDLEYLGDGVLKMKPKKGGGASYVASIVGVSKDENVGLLYVCSEQGKAGQDMRYVIVRKDVNPDKVEHPDIMFKDVNEQYHFKGMYRRLPSKSFSTKAMHWFK